MAALLGDDDFDQFDKPGAERSRRRRVTDEEWDSELEDDLLEEDLSGKKVSPDFSDEELNDDLLQSDEEEQDTANYSSQGVTVSLNATAGELTSFDLSKSMNEEFLTEEAEYEEVENEEAYESLELQDAGTEDLPVDSCEENYAELVDEQAEYGDEETTDEVLELEINEPLDEFQEEEYSQSFRRQEVIQEQYMDDATEEATEPENLANESEEIQIESHEFPPDSKEESDEDDDEEEGGGRIRFKTERKEGTIIRLSDATRERRNIPETLELSAEAKASLMKFEEMERQRKLERYDNRRGGRRGVNYGMISRMGGQRNDYNDRRNARNRPPQGQPIRSPFMQQNIQPLLSMPRSRNTSSDGLHSLQQEKSRMGNNVATPPKQQQQQQQQQQQPKNIHINPHFKGNVAPVQVPLLPVPNQPRPSMGPPRFPGMPEFPHPPNPVPGNFNTPPRLQEPWRNPPPPPPPQPEREPFFIGEPRFPNHHMFDQRNPPPGPPPPLLNSNNHSVPNQNPPPFNPPGQGLNQPGPQPRFNQPQANFNPPGPGPQTSFNPPTPQSGFNQSGFNPPGPQPGFNQQGPQSGFNSPGPQSGFNPSGNQPGFNQPNFNHPNPQPGFNQSGPQPPFNLPGLNQPGFNQSNPGPQPGFNQPGSGPQPNFPPHGPGPQPGFNSPGFSRERPVRVNMPSPSPMGMPPFNQPANLRHFGPPRQPFPPGPGQPFMPLTQSNLQSPMQPPMQSMHQHHHHGGPPKPPMPMQQPPPFRTHSQSPQTPSHRMPGQQRHGPVKQRQIMPNQNMVKSHNMPLMHPRNSNLRELPIAPSHSMDMTQRKSDSPAQIKPIGTTAPQARTEGFGNAQAVRPMNSFSPAKEEAKVEQFPDEDEETRKYRLKIEEQKRLREEILKRKELRRQQQAGARKKELLERLSQQQPTNAQPSQPEPENPTTKLENSASQILPHITTQHTHVKSRLISRKPESVPANLPQKIPLLQPAVPNVSFQGQPKKVIKQTVQNRPATENPIPKVHQVCPTVSLPAQGPHQTVKVVPIQGKPQDQRPMAAKRTVMQRSNSGGADGAHIASKVRVIKLSGTGDCVSVQSSEANPQMQRMPPQQRPPFQQRAPQKSGPVRKVTLGKGSVQQHQQQYQVKPRPHHSPGEAMVPHVVNSIQGQHPAAKVIMRGRGRGGGGQMGRGRLMPNKQNLRVVECKPQPCVVSVEGLSSSTTDHQLRNLLMSVGPIQLPNHTVDYSAVMRPPKNEFSDVSSSEKSHSYF